MSWFILLYVYTVLESLVGISILFIVASSFIVVILTAISVGEGQSDSGDKMREIRSNLLKRGWITLYTILLLVVILTPGREDLKFIVGGGLAGNSAEWALNSEEMQKLPDNLVKSLNHFITEIGDGNAE